MVAGDAGERCEAAGMHGRRWVRRPLRAGRGAHAGAGCPTIAPVRGSMRTAAKIPLAATAITTNSAPKPQVAWIPAMTGRWRP